MAGVPLSGISGRRDRGRDLVVALLKPTLVATAAGSKCAERPIWPARGVSICTSEAEHNGGSRSPCLPMRVAGRHLR